MPFYTWPTYLNLCISIFIFLLTLGVLWYIWNHRKIPGVPYFIILTAGGSLWALFYFLELISPALLEKIRWDNLEFTVLSVLPLFYLTFILIYTGQKRRIEKWIWVVFSLEPIANQVMMWTNASHHLFRLSAFIENGGLAYPGILISSYGNWYWFNTIYTLVFFLIDLLVLFYNFFRAPHWARNRLWFLIAGTFIPWVSSIINLPEWIFNKYDYTLPLSLAISLLIIAWGVLHTRILDILPIAREALLDQISDAVIVIDAYGHVVETNQAAKHYIQTRNSTWEGLPFQQLIPELSNFDLDRKIDFTRQLEVPIKSGGEDLIFDLRISPLVNEKKNISGWLAIFHDITEIKKESEKLREAETQAESALHNVRVHAEELAIIRSSTELLNQATTLRGALLPALEAIKDMSQASQIWLLLLDQSNLKYHRKITYFPEDTLSHLKFSEFLLNNTPCLKDLLREKLLKPQCYTRSKPEISDGSEETASTYFAFPLYSGQCPVGILNLGYNQNSPLDEETFHLVETLCNSLSVAIDRVRLLKSAYTERRIAEANQQIIANLTASLKLDDVLDVLLDQISRLIPISSGNVMRVDGEYARVIRTKGYGFLGKEGEQEIAHLTFKIADTPNIQKIVETCKPVIIDDTTSSEDWFATAGTAFFKSWLGAPVIIDGRVEMIFSLDKQEVNFFQQQHSEQLEAFCSEASLAIQNARLFQSGEKRIKELESLRATLTDISAQLDLQQLLKEIMERALSLLDSTSGILGLYDEKQGMFKIAFSITDGKDLTNSTIPAGKGLMGTVAKARKPMALENYPAWPNHLEEHLSLFPHAALEVPLFAGENFVGVLGIGDANPLRKYNGEDSRLLTMFAQQVTVALGNARLFTEAKQRAEEAETLRQASAIVASTLKQKQALHLILEQLSFVVPYDSASILLLKQGALELVEGRGFNENANPIGLRIGLNLNQPGVYVFKNKKPLVIQNMPEVYPEFNDLNPLPIRSWIGVPLIIHDRTIGILALDSLQENRYTENQAHLISAFADQVAISLENVRLYENAVKSTNRLTTLYKLGQRISAHLRPEEVYHAIHRATKDLMSSDTFILSFYDKDNQMINDVYFIDHDVPQNPSQRPIGTGLFSRAITENRSLMFNDFTEEDIKKTQAVIIGDEKDETLVRSLIVVPLRIGKEIKGILSTQSYQANAFTEDDKETLELLATQSAIALENSRLFTELQDMAMTDALTKIYNRRKFFEIAELEFERSRRYQHPLSVIMMDIDHFKLVNDNYGHAAGDVVLKQVAKICQDSMRNVDILARYGGEEFVVMLPETTVDEAQLTAERLRMLIARTPIMVDQVSLPITLSFGVVELDSTCKNIEELLDRSDQAMYHSKRHGRNRFTVWSTDLHKVDPTSPSNSIP